MNTSTNIIKNEDTDRTRPEDVFDHAEQSSSQQSFKKAPTFMVITALIGGVLFGTLGGFMIGRNTTSFGSSSSQRMMGGPGGNKSQVSMKGSFGTVASITSTSITLKDSRQNTAKSYTISDTTSVINNGNDANVADITVGDSVRVELSSSDTNTLKSIELNPTMGMMGGPGKDTSNSTNQSK